MSFYLLKMTPIQVYSHGKAVTHESWSLGYWKYSENSPNVWGLLHNGYHTHMCYGIDYAKPQDCIATLNNYDPPATDWYFDAGNELTVKKSDLEQGFKDLGIWF